MGDGVWGVGWASINKPERDEGTDYKYVISMYKEQGIVFFALLLFMISCLG